MQKGEEKCIIRIDVKRKGICNFSEPRKFTFCECVHSNRIVNLYGEVTTFAKEKLQSSDFVNVVLNSYRNIKNERIHKVTYV